MTHESYNEFHLGDNLIHLHFLRKLALRYPREEFVHAVHECHLRQLMEVVEDVPKVRLIRIEEKSPRAVNVWKNAGATVTDGKPTPNYVPGYWEQHPERNNYGRFYVAWFDCLARKMGLESPIRNPQDLWFDYPKIAYGYTERVCQVLEAVCGSGPLPPEGGVPSDMRFDFLVVNSQPCSGQFRAYNEVEYLTPLIHELAARYSVVCTQPITSAPSIGDVVDGTMPPRVVCTRDYGLTISQVGTLSLHAVHLVMVSTGPSWPTFNVWNVEMVALRLLMLDTECVDYMPGIVQVNNREAARAELVRRGLL